MGGVACDPDAATIPRMHRNLICSLTCILALSGCVPREVNTWRPRDANVTTTKAQSLHGSELVSRSVSVVFAPVAIGPLAPIHPDARLGFAFDLAERIDVLGRKADAEGYAAPTLPTADDAAWTRWPVAGATGADIVVLTTVLSIDKHEELSAASGGKQISCTALVEMRALDELGNVVFHKRGRGDWSGKLSPKFSGPDSQPETITAWEGCSNTVGALLEFLERRNEAETTGTTAPSTARLVEVEITSDPAGGDLLIDGIFRGNTPCVLKLPARRVVLRIERHGHVAWERTLVPDADMKIRPVLELLPTKLK